MNPQDILQEVMMHPEVRQHFGHMAGFFSKDNQPPASLPTAPKGPKSTAEKVQPQYNSPSYSQPMMGDQAPIVINTPAPQVTVNVPPAEAPIINVTLPKMEFPKQEAPKVTVNVDKSEPEEPTSVETSRDESGRIDKIVETYKNGQIVTVRDGDKWTIDDKRK